MKQFLSITLVLLALAGCTDNKKDLNEKQQQIDSLANANAQLQSQQQQMDEMMAMVTDVQEAFRQINEAEGRIAISSSQPETASARENIRENLQFITQTLNDNREKIALLEQRLRTSGINVERLTSTVQNLQTQLEQQNQLVQQLQTELAQRDIVIAEQGEQIEQLNDNVEQLSSSNEQQQQVIATQDQNLNRAWYVFGTKAELREQGILTRDGVMRSGNFNHGYFTPIDIRIDKVINLYSKNAKILTNHPDGSYTLDKNSEGKYVLTITEPESFWSASKYLVVQVK